MKLMLVLTALLLSACAGGQQLNWAAWDEMRSGSNQVSDAMASGYRQPQNQSYEAPKQIDYTCQQRCLSAGYQYQLCQNKCSF